MYLITLVFNLFSGSLQARAVDVMVISIHTKVLELFSHNRRLAHKAHASKRHCFTVINWLCKWRRMLLVIGATH